MASAAHGPGPEATEAPSAEPAPQAPGAAGPLLSPGPSGILFLQRHAGNAAVSRMLAGGRAGPPPQRMILRERVGEGSPGKRENMDVGDTGPGVTLLQRLLGANQTGTFDAQTRAAVDRFQRQQGWDPGGVGPGTWAAIDGHEGTPGHRPNLVEGDRGPGVALLQKLVGVEPSGYFGGATRKAVDVFQRAQGWEPSGVGPMTWEALDRAAGNQVPEADPMKEIVRGTYVDDFKEVVYEIDYRIEEKGGPSEYLQVIYDDNSQIDLNWYDFDDVKLTGTEVADALRNRYRGLGDRIFPKRPSANGRLGLTRQLCPRLWEARLAMDEEGAKSTLKLMGLSMSAVMFIITVPAMPAGPVPESPSTSWKANRRAIPKGNAPSFVSQQTRARELVNSIKGEGKEVVVNLGGAGAKHEPQGAININNQAVARKNIPNLVQADGSRVGDLIPPGSADRIEGYYMAPGAVRWKQAAPGSFSALKSGGKLSYRYRGMSPDAKVAGQALKDAGFKDVQVVGDAYVTAVKP
jgi:peptidoglycan hydrolase-like protein with peptidoglycan-binding domain